MVCGDCFWPLHPVVYRHNPGPVNLASAGIRDGLYVRRNWKNEIRIIRLPGFYLDIQHRAAALLLDDAAGRLDVRQDFSMVGITGIFRFRRQVRQSGIAGPYLDLCDEVLRIERRLYRKPGELAIQWKRHDCGSILRTHSSLLAGNQSSLDHSVGERPELKKPFP